MVAKSTTALERMLLERVERELDLAPGAAVENAHAIEALRSELHAPDVSAEEAEQVRVRQQERVPGEAFSDIQMAVRIERALATVSRVAAAEAGRAPPTAPPRVLLLRDEGIEASATLSRGYQSLGETFSRERDNRSLLVLAERNARARFEEDGLPELNATLQARKPIAERQPRQKRLRDAIDAVEIRELPPHEEIAAQLSERPVTTAAATPTGLPTFGGKYRVVKELGRGGFGAVYEAEDLTLGHRVAIKMIHGQASLREAQKQAFKDEARRVIRLAHPNIVDWKNFEEAADGSCWFVMELLRGEDLDAVLKREKRLDPKRAMRLMLQVLSALRAAHDPKSGDAILHLDLKPKNVFLVPDPQSPGGERAKVIDFGIGQAAGATDKEKISMTPEYASPEQCAYMVSGAETIPLDARSDLYSFGVMAFQLLTGELPFAAPKRRLDWLDLHRSTAPKLLASSGVKMPRALARFVDRCLEKDRDARWADTDEAFAALDRIVNPPILTRVLPVAVPLLVVIIAVAVYGYLRPNQSESVSLLDPAGKAVATDKLRLGSTQKVAQLHLPVSAAVQLEVGAAVDLLPADGKAAPSWLTAHVVDARTLEVVVDSVQAPPSGRHELNLQLSVPTTSGTRSSNAFSLVWLGPDVWQTRADVPDLGSLRAIDPSNAKLLVTLLGKEEDVASVDVSAEGAAGQKTRLSAELDRTFQEADHLRYSVALDPLLGAATEAKISMTVIDRAGRAVTARFPESDSEKLDLVAGQPEFKASLTNGHLIGADQFSISKGADPSLHVETDHLARLTYQVNVINGQSGSERPLGDVRPGGSFDFQISEIESIGKDNGGKDYSGVIVLKANDAGLVHRRDKTRGLFEKTVAFKYYATRLSVVVQMENSSPPGGLAQPVQTLTEADPVFVSGGTVKLKLQRTRNDVPVRFIVDQLDAGGRVVGKSPDPIDITLATEMAKEQALDLSAAPDSTLRVQVFRIIDELANKIAEQPDVDSRFRVVVDSTAPKLTLTNAKELQDTVIDTDERLPAPATIAVFDEVIAGAPPTPIDLKCNLLHDGRPVSSVSLDGQFPAKTMPGETLTLTWPEEPLLTEFKKADGDGSWSAQIAAIDAVGHPVALEASWTVARSGPSLELVSPRSNVDWTPDNSSGGFSVQIRARDPNGVASVTAYMVLVEKPADVKTPTKWEVKLTPDGKASATDTLWTGVVTDMPREWTYQKINFDLHAVDGSGRPGGRPGMPSATSEPRKLGQVQTVRFRSITLAIRGVAGESLTLPMRLVEGNNTREYIFGGRDEAEENRLFARADAKKRRYHDSNEPESSWRIRLERGAIKDFYVDEHATTGVEMLPFLISPQGYEAVANRDWDFGAGRSRTPFDPERLARLKASATDRPICGISWDEARAFARSTGRRLLTLAEWEYALRGDSYVLGTDKDGGAAVWTETPVWLEARESPFDSPLKQFKSAVGFDWLTADQQDLDTKRVARNIKQLTELYDPEAIHTDADRYRDFDSDFWVAGLPANDGSTGFASVAPWRRGEFDEAIGMRCAIDVDTLDKVIADPTGRITIVKKEN